MSALATGRPVAPIVYGDAARQPIPAHLLGGDQEYVSFSLIIRVAPFRTPGQLWERAAEAYPPRVPRGSAARARRGRGASAYAGEAFGFHRDSHGVIVAGADRFPLRVR